MSHTRSHSLIQHDPKESLIKITVTVFRAPISHLNMFPRINQILEGYPKLKL